MIGLLWTTVIIKTVGVTIVIRVMVMLGGKLRLGFVLREQLKLEVKLRPWVGS